MIIFSKPVLAASAGFQDSDGMRVFECSLREKFGINLGASSRGFGQVVWKAGKTFCTADHCIASLDEMAEAMGGNFHEAKDEVAPRPDDQWVQEEIHDPRLALLCTVLNGHGAPRYFVAGTGRDQILEICECKLSKRGPVPFRLIFETVAELETTDGTIPNFVRDCREFLISRSDISNRLDARSYVEPNRLEGTSVRKVALDRLGNMQTFASRLAVPWKFLLLEARDLGYGTAMVVPNWHSRSGESGSGLFAGESFLGALGGDTGDEGSDGIEISCCSKLTGEMAKIFQPHLVKGQGGEEMILLKGSWFAVVHWTAQGDKRLEHEKAVKKQTIDYGNLESFADDGV